MGSGDFFEVFFSHLDLFLILMFVFSSTLYFCVRGVAPAAYLDPIHFYYTFTFGTSYGIIVGLYSLGYISGYIFSVVMSYGVLFVMLLRLFVHLSRHKKFSIFRVFLVPRGEGSFQFFIVLLVYVFLLVFLWTQVGLGVSAETNRFEQNRGFGAFVRVADGIRIFVLAYLTLVVYRRWLEERKISLKSMGLIFFILVLIVVSSAINGAKFAMLEGLYSCFVAMAIFYKKPKFNIIYAACIFLLALVFAMFVLSSNLEKKGLDVDAAPSYMPGGDVLTERLVLRILSNADKYYLTLPGGVLDKLQTDDLWVRFVAPMVGTTRLSSMLGYNVNNYNVGRQALLYYDPNYEIAGGPTSHFDLFVYKYFGNYFGWMWVTFSAFMFAVFIVLSRQGCGDIYFCAIVTTLWLRSLPMLLEPTVGFAYVLDIFIIFTLIKLFCSVLPRKVDAKT